MPVLVRARIVDGHGAEVLTSAERLDPVRFGSTRAADYRFELPLSVLAPGPHLLTIEATAGTAGARRDLRFTVRAG